MTTEQQPSKEWHMIAQTPEGGALVIAIVRTFRGKFRYSYAIFLRGKRFFVRNRKHFPKHRFPEHSLKSRSIAAALNDAWDTLATLEHRCRSPEDRADLAALQELLQKPATEFRREDAAHYVWQRQAKVNEQLLRSA